MDVSWLPRIEVTHFGALCLHVMRRSDRSCEVVSIHPDNISTRRDGPGGVLGFDSALTCEESLTMPVAGSTVRLSVSTAITCGVFSFHGPYFRQLLVETSSHE